MNHTRSTRLPGISLALWAFITAVTLGPANAATISVASGAVAVNDNGSCSLREAIENAVADATVNDDCSPNGAYGADVIELPSATYTLPDGPYAGDGTNGLPVITDTLTIHGHGATIRRDLGAGSNFRILSITFTGNLSLDNVTLRDGVADGVGLGQRGGALMNRGGTVALDTVTVRNNTAVDGAGIGTSGSGTTMLIESALGPNNVASGSGGGLYNGETHAFVAEASTISGNQAPIGGAIATYGSVELNCTTVSENEANYGGGIFEATTGTTLLSGSALVNNVASDDGSGSGIGGGAYVSGNNVGSVGTTGFVVVNSTIANNRADGDGGGVYNASGNVLFFNATVVGNTADDDNNGSGDGGGVIQTGDTLTLGMDILLFPAQTRLINTILANNVDRGGESPECGDQQTSPLSTAINSDGYNIIEDTTGCPITEATNAGTDTTGVDPALGPLAIPTGTTCRTSIACPLSGVAIDGGNPNGCVDPNGATLTVDQRDVTRPIDGAGALLCDIGACEFGFVPPVESNPAPAMDMVGLGLLVATLGAVAAYAERRRV